MYLMKSAPVCLALKCSSRSSAGKAKLLLYFTVIFQRTCDFQTEIFLPCLLDSFFFFSFFKWASWFTYLPRLSFLLKSAPLLCKSFIHSTLLEREENRRWTKQKFTSVLPPLPKNQKSYSIFVLFAMQKQGTDNYNVKLHENEALKTYFFQQNLQVLFCRRGKKWQRAHTKCDQNSVRLEIFNGSCTRMLPTLNPCKRTWKESCCELVKCQSNNEEVTFNEIHPRSAKHSTASTLLESCLLSKI